MVAFPTWLKTALPIAGLGALPLAGTVYVAIAPSPTAVASARSSTPTSVTAPIRPSEIPDSPFVSHATDAPPPRPTSLAALGANRAAFAPPETAVARDAAKHLCCEKLTDMAQGADVSIRATYQAASAACNAAPSNDDAYRQVATVIQGSSALVPAECRKR